jgi:hypothetical protein
MDINGTTIDNPQIILKAMNQYLLTIADSINNSTHSNSYNTVNSPIEYIYKTFNKPFLEIKYKNIARHEIEKIIMALKLSTSCGYDEIPVNILKL